MKVSVTLGLLVWTAACHPRQTTSELQEAIRIQCAPVEDLLRKNIHKSGSLRVAGIAGGGGEYSREGAILESSEAAQVHRIDAACRSWVSGRMSDQAYMDVIIGQVAGAVSLGTLPADQSAAIETLVADLKKLTALPQGGVDHTRLAAEIARLNLLDARSVRSEMARPDSDMPPVWANALPDVVARLDYLEQLLEENPAVSQPPTVVGRANGFDVYFSTGSAELTFESSTAVRDEGRALALRGALVTVTGYADARGSSDLNLRLSAARAEAVADLLKSVGVTVTLAQGAGSTTQGPQEYDRARRVAIRITP